MDRGQGAGGSPLLSTDLSTESNRPFHTPITTNHPPRSQQTSRPITTKHPPITTKHPPITTNNPPITTKHPPITTNNPPITTNNPPNNMVATRNFAVKNNRPFYTDHNKQPAPITTNNPPRSRAKLNTPDFSELNTPRLKGPSTHTKSFDLSSTFLLLQTPAARPVTTHAPPTQTMDAPHSATYYMKYNYFNTIYHTSIKPKTLSLNPFLT